MSERSFEDLQKDAEALKKEDLEAAKFVRIEDGKSVRLKFLDNGSFPVTKPTKSGPIEVIQYQVLDLMAENKQKEYGPIRNSAEYRELLNYSLDNGGTKGKTLSIAKKKIGNRNSITITEIARE